VNIHPRKQEIKFSEYDKLLETIKNTIDKKIKIESIYQTTKASDFKQEKLVFNEPKREVYKPTPTTEKKEVNTPIVEEPKREVLPDFEYIGQYTGTYLLFQNEEGLYLLDQHAAAERIRYEKYQMRMTKSDYKSQDLLVPLELSLSNELLIQLSDYLDELFDFGIDAKITNNVLVINKIPIWFPKNYELIYTEAVVMNLLENKSFDSKDIIDDLAKLLACKHSLKANHFITKNEAEVLVNDLKECERPYTCPHGRPILVKISLDQIERLFNRVM
jgi:DNA mismatch repair protein MutL